MSALRLLLVGDVIGRAGCEAIRRLVPALREELRLDAVIVNGENSADNGFGITAATAQTLLGVADCVTLGDHTFDQPGTDALLEREPRLIRPANYEAEVAGRGWGTFTTANGVRVGVINLLGKVFMQPRVKAPYAVADVAVNALRAAGAQVIVVDMQAEATSEKQAMGWHLAGKVAAVVGTHTHVPTADLRVLPGGTAYVSDLGMTGSRDSIIGYALESLLTTLVTRVSSGPPYPGAAPVRLDAVLVVADPTTGQALSIERVTREDPGA